MISITQIVKNQTWLLFVRTDNSNYRSDFAQQVHYPTDKAASSSKKSNAGIFDLHYFFDNFGLGEKTLHHHCDNCAGQTKNRYMLSYFAWNVQSGLHSDVTINFMLPGHTVCSRLLFWAAEVLFP